MLYRIYTENVNHLETVKRIKSYFPGGFTLITGIGYWEGGEEHSTIIDIMTDNESIEWCAENFLRDIKKTFGG